MGDIDVGGIRHHYDVDGSGLPVVLVHGLGGRGDAVWRNVVPALARDVRVITYDLRGSGRSESPPGPYAMGDFSDDLVTLLDALGLGQAVLIGHSMGGSIALLTASRYPERVQAVVGVGAPLALSPEAQAGVRKRAETVEAGGMREVAEAVGKAAFAPAFQEAHPALVAEYVELVAACDPSGYAAQCRALADLDLAGELGRIRAPAVLVNGDVDYIAPSAAAEVAAGQIPRCERVVLPGCGHIVPWERPDELVGAMRGVLSSLTEGR